MARKVIWADAAQEDLEAAAAYIHRDSPYYAASFVRRTLEAARSLAKFPLRGSMVREFGDTNIREIIVYSYRLIYHVEKNQISISRSFLMKTGVGSGRLAKWLLHWSSQRVDDCRGIFGSALIGLAGMKRKK